MVALTLKSLLSRQRSVIHERESVGEDASAGGQDKNWRTSGTSLQSGAVIIFFLINPECRISDNLSRSWIHALPKLTLRFWIISVNKVWWRYYYLRCLLCLSVCPNLFMCPFLSLSLSSYVSIPLSPFLHPFLHLNSDKLLNKANKQTNKGEFFIYFQCRPMIVIPGPFPKLALHAPPR